MASNHSVVLFLFLLFSVDLSKVLAPLFCSCNPSFFNSASLQCIACGANQTRSSDSLHSVCKDGYTVKDVGSLIVECAVCTGTASQDKRRCLKWLHGNVCNCTAGQTQVFSTNFSQFPQPVFYELFLQYSDSQGNESLWLVPDMSSPGSSQVQQRFFLVDGLTGRQNNLNSQPQYVTYASKLVLSFQFSVLNSCCVYQPISSPGNDSPFKMTVQCTTVDNNGEPNSQAQVIGVINIAVRELNLAVQPGADNYLAPWSPILRYGITASVWQAVVILFLSFLLSVFILLHQCYGFYIHGHSVHGHADVSMETMHTNLQKEKIQMALSSAMFFIMGMMLALLLFDTLLFCIIDLGTQGIVLATIILYLVQQLLEMLWYYIARITSPKRHWWTSAF